MAVGAGQHEQLSSSPYTFSRTYNLEEEDEDKVVVSLTGKSGTATAGDTVRLEVETGANATGNETFSCAPSEGQLTKRVKILSN